MEQYLGEMFSAILAALITYFSTRKRQKVDTKQIEVDVLEKSLKVIHADVVEPLSERFKLLQDDYSEINKQLIRLQNAINQMYKCRMLESCPIRVKLQDTKTSNRKGNSSRAGSNRPRDSTNRENNESNNDSDGDGNNDLDAGANQ